MSKTHTYQEINKYTLIYANICRLNFLALKKEHFSNLKLKETGEREQKNLKELVHTQIIVLANGKLSLLIFIL